MSLEEEMEAVRTREDFVAFVRALLDDLIDHRDGPAWENPTLERFLEAMAAWVEDTRETYPLVQTSWGDLAQILIAARSYE